MAPYRELGTPVGCRFFSSVPSKSIAALKEGKALAAAVPVGGLLALEGLVEPIGRFGIAAKQESQSVLFFSNQPFAAIRAPATIYLTNESASSVRLLYLLIGYRQGFNNIPFQTNNKKEADGELLIGDAALHMMRQRQTRSVFEPSANPVNSRFEYVTDLAGGWHEAHNLPFVFARWVIRKDAPLEARRSLHSWLSEFRDREEELVLSSAPKAAKDLGVTINDVIQYLRVLRRILVDEDLAGQELFLSEIRKHTRTPLFLRKPCRNNSESAARNSSGLRI